MSFHVSDSMTTEYTVIFLLPVKYVYVFLWFYAFVEQVKKKIAVDFT